MKTLTIILVNGLTIETGVPDDFNAAQWWQSALGFKGQLALTMEDPQGNMLLFPQDKVLMLKIEPRPNHEGGKRVQ